MDVICGRKTVGQISGTIMVNGHPKVQRTWSRVVGYVEQMDIHTAAQTVVEALWFSARLRLPPTVSDKQVSPRYKIRSLFKKHTWCTNLHLYNQLNHIILAVSWTLSY